jgi:hypothetical protein
MIAESPSSISRSGLAQHQGSQPESRARIQEPMSLKRIAAALQVVLASRRAARNDEHAYWYTVARGM